MTLRISGVEGTNDGVQEELDARNGLNHKRVRSERGDSIKDEFEEGIHGAFRRGKSA